MRLIPVAPFPIADPTTDAGKQAAELHAAWREQHGRAAQVETDYQAARQELPAADVALREALADAELKGDHSSSDVAKAEKRYAAAKEAAEGPWEQRAAATFHAAEQRRGEYAAFVDANLDELLADGLLTDAADARQGIIDAAEALQASIDRWREVLGNNSLLIAQASSIDGQAMPEMSGPVAAIEQPLDTLLLSTDSIPSPAPQQRHLRERRRVLAEADEAPVSSSAAEAGDEG
ncbi:MAG TPA: hypothetical protein VHR18_13415 [Solirubrobacterales bacterium]|jgi:hypothetical protein|nr:hypothetical protein [Solirubrobacterales bacterium]